MEYAIQVNSHSIYRSESHKHLHHGPTKKKITNLFRMFSTCSTTSRASVQQEKSVTKNLILSPLYQQSLNDMKRTRSRSLNLSSGILLDRVASSSLLSREERRAFERANKFMCIIMPGLITQKQNMKRALLYSFRTIYSGLISKKHNHHPTTQRF